MTPPDDIGTEEEQELRAAAQELLTALLLLEDESEPIAFEKFFKSARMRERLRVKKTLAEMPQREREVMELLGEGLTGKQIADRLSISPASILTYARSGIARMRDLEKGGELRYHSQVREDRSKALKIHDLLERSSKLGQDSKERIARLEESSSRQ